MQYQEKNSMTNSCRICEGSESKVIAQLETFQYVMCSVCGVIRMYPYPSKNEIDNFYANYYQQKINEGQGYLSEENYNAFKAEKELTLGDLGFVPKGDEKSCLDIGCATGDFVKLMNSYGYDTVGIDMSDDLIEKAIKRELKCYRSNLDEVNRQYEVISLFHVIEHVEFPKDYLRKIYSLLVEKGDFLIETPCYGVIGDSFEENWRFFMPIEHLHLFSQKSLFKLLYDSGFIIKKWIRFGSGNTSGTVPKNNKIAMDRIAKKLGIGDTIAIWANRGD